MGSRVLLLLAVTSCAPRGRAEVIEWNAPFPQPVPAADQPAPPFQDLLGMTPAARKDRVREQFIDPVRARTHGTGGHMALDCPQCLDPMRAILPESAWLTGPADVWN